MSFYCFNLPFFIIGSQTIFVHCVSVFLFSRIPSSCVLPIFQFLKLLFDHVSSLPMSLFCLPSKSSTIKVCSSHPLKRCHHTHSVHALPVAKRRPSCLHSPHLTSTRPWQLHERHSCSLPCIHLLSGAVYSLTSFITCPPAALDFSTL